ncbi:uncharacterized protein [Heliangelus exortis]|uniref:uncharacterized protein n=1 Tax=Heliangelus exortis TaxID=472823 RepID=UPI003A8D9ADC
MTEGTGTRSPIPGLVEAAVPVAVRVQLQVAYSDPEKILSTQNFISSSPFLPALLAFSAAPWNALFPTFPVFLAPYPAVSRGCSAGAAEPRGPLTARRRFSPLSAPPFSLTRERGTFLLFGARSYDSSRRPSSPDSWQGLVRAVLQPGRCNGAQRQLRAVPFGRDVSHPEAADSTENTAGTLGGALRRRASYRPACSRMSG